MWGVSYVLQTSITFKFPDGPHLYSGVECQCVPWQAGLTPTTWSVTDPSHSDFCADNSKLDRNILLSCVNITRNKKVKIFPSIKHDCDRVITTIMGYERHLAFVSENHSLICILFMREIETDMMLVVMQGAGCKVLKGIQIVTPVSRGEVWLLYLFGLK